MRDVLHCDELHALKIVVTAQSGTENSHDGFEEATAKRREQVVARVVGKGWRQPAHLRVAPEVGQPRRSRRRLERDARCRKDVTESRPGGRLAEAVLGPQDSAGRLEVVPKRVLVQSRVLADPVEVEIRGEMGKTDLSFEPVVEPMAHIADQDAPRSILGSESSDDRDVGSAETRLGLAQGLAEKRQRPGRAVPDRRLRDRDDHRKKSEFLVEKAADIEPSVLRRAEFRRRRCVLR
jgi:hypothetical protein